jgi:hypothetical protein
MAVKVDNRWYSVLDDIHAHLELQEAALAGGHIGPTGPFPLPPGLGPLPPNLGPRLTALSERTEVLRRRAEAETLATNSAQLVRTPVDGSSVSSDGTAAQPSHGWDAL